MRFPRGVNLTESEHAGSAFRNCTFDRAILHHSIFRQWSLLGSVFTDCRMRPLSLLECDFTLAVLGGRDLWGAASWSAHHSSLGLVAVNRRLTRSTGVSTPIRLGFRRPGRGSEVGNCPCDRKDDEMAEVEERAD